jgi:hypothetical protein
MRHHLHPLAPGLDVEMRGSRGRLKQSKISSVISRISLAARMSSGFLPDRAGSMWVGQESIARPPCPSLA